MASRSDTKTRILDAAEKLFAERGFSETSLRLITSKAEVNLASVNYHFGSKKELIRAVLARYLDVFMPSASNAINELIGRDKQASLDAIFSSLVGPLLELNKVRNEGTSIFLQLLGRGYIESQGTCAGLLPPTMVSIWISLFRLCPAVHLTFHRQRCSGACTLPWEL